MPDFGVSEKKQRELNERMRKFGVREQDIIEKFIRSRGHGGQNVNKVSSCVYLKHIPTGVEVKVQRERSQSTNRFLARRLLTDKIEQRILGTESRAMQEREKIRRQKRKRSRRAKEKVLRDKKAQSLKKALRTRIDKTIT